MFFFCLAGSNCHVPSDDLGSSFSSEMQTSLSTTGTLWTELDDSGFLAAQNEECTGMCTPSGHHEDNDNVDIVKMQKVIKVTILWKMFLI